ncbi:MAG: hypothetical protein U0W24_05075 [Bacteroidales bacterium]
MNLKKSHKIVHVLCLLLFSAAILLGCQTNNKSRAFQQNPNGRNDSWGYVGAGGGGAMFNPTVSPHNQNMAFVSCDMGGSFVTYNGGEQWRMFHLFEMTRFFVFDPKDSNVIYANSLALFKSSDKGNTWNLIYPPASEIKGMVAKGDHAEYVLITKDSSERKVLALAVDPSDSKKLFAAISVNNIISLFLSEDGGNQWLKDKNLFSGVKNIFIDPTSPEKDRTLYVAGSEGIMQRINGVWQTNSLPAGVKKMTTYAGGFDKNQNKVIIYGISGLSYFNYDGDKSGIFYTENGGKTWENREDGLLKYGIKTAGLAEWRAIGTSAQYPDVVYVSYANLKVNNDTTCIGVAKSTDFGKTWQLVWKDNLCKDRQIPSANFNADWITERFGPTWGENPFGLGVAPTNPDICYGTDFGRAIKTADGGKTWIPVYTKKVENGWTSSGLEVTTGYNVVFDPFDKNHVFLALTDIGLMESHDCTKSWNSATFKNGIPKNWINSTYWLVFDKDVKGRAWAVMSGTHDLPRPKMFRKNGTKNYEGGIVMTEDAGKTWEPVSSSAGEGAFTYIIYDPSSPKESRVLYACAFGKGVYKSTDGGKTWLSKNKGINGEEPFAWRIERRAKDGALFLIVSRRGEDGSIGSDKDGALYKSVDGAESWEKIPLPSETNAPTSLVFDKSGNILLSAWGRKTSGIFEPEIGGGIYSTTDDGKTWKPVLTNDQHIHDVTFDERNNRFYACGFNGSAYYSEDGGNTWNRIKGYNFKWGKRVEPDPLDPEKIYIITFGGGVWYDPAKGDEKAVEDIITRFN